MTDTQSKLAAQFLNLGATKDVAEKCASYVVAHSTEILHPVSIASITIANGVLKIVGTGFGTTKGKIVASLGSGPDAREVVATKWSDTSIEAPTYIGASKDDTIEVTTQYGLVTGVVAN